MELELQTTFTTGKYEITNYAQIKSKITSAIEKYLQLVVTEETLPDAKMFRAKLNNFAKAIDDERKAKEREYMAAFIGKQQCNELKSIIDEASKNLDIQIKEFENKAKDEKKTKINKYFDELAVKASLDGKINFDDLFKEEWLNKTYDSEKIADEIQTAISNVVDGLTILDTLIKDSEELEKAKVFLYRTYNLQETLSYLHTELKEKDNENVKKAVDEETPTYNVVTVTFKGLNDKQIKRLHAILLSNNFKYQLKVEEEKRKV